MLLQDVRKKFILPGLSWWGGFYERLVKVDSKENIENIAIFSI